VTPRVWIALAAAVVALGGAAASGHKLASYQADARVTDCSASITDLTLTKCPVAIQTAFAAVKGQLAVKEVEYRDRTIPVIVNGRAEDRAAREALSAQVDALNQMERTHACAASPAFELRRRQLLLDAEAAADPAGG